MDKNIVVDTSMSDLAARATTATIIPPPRRGEGGGGERCSAIAMESTRIVIRCIVPTACGKMGGRGEYRVSNISGPSAVAKLIAE